MDGKEVWELVSFSFDKEGVLFCGYRLARWKYLETTFEHGKGIFARYHCLLSLF